jgi:ribosome-associated translation inhibitor RaiA
LEKFQGEEKMTLIPLIQGANPGKSMEVIFHSPNEMMNRYFEQKLTVLERYLPSNTKIDIDLKGHHAKFDISTLKHEYIFEEDGSDLFDAITTVLEEARKFLRLEHQRHIENIHRKFIEDSLYLER